MAVYLPSETARVSWSGVPFTLGNDQDFSMHAHCRLSTFVNPSRTYQIVYSLCQVSGTEIHGFAFKEEASSQARAAIFHNGDIGDNDGDTLLSAIGAGGRPYACGLSYEGHPTTASSTTSKVYLDGSLDLTTSFSSWPTWASFGQVRVAQTGGTQQDWGIDDGYVSEFGIWDVTLNAGEFAALAKGVPPFRIRPNNLVFYAPLTDGYNDVIGGKTGVDANSAALSGPHSIFTGYYPSITIGAPASAGQITASTSATFSLVAGVASGVTVTTNKTSYLPDESILCTISQSSYAPNGAKINGVTESVSNATTTSCTVTAPPLSDFVATGDHDETRLDYLVDLELTFSQQGDSFPVSIRITPQLGSGFFFYSATGTAENGIHPSNVASGDSVLVEDESDYITSVTSEGVVTASNVPATGQIRYFDESASPPAWSASTAFSVTLLTQTESFSFFSSATLVDAKPIVETNVSNIDFGDSIVCFIEEAPGVPTSATINGSAVSILSGATSNLATIAMEPKSAFKYGGSAEDFPIGSEQLEIILYFEGGLDSNPAYVNLVSQDGIIYVASGSSANGIHEDGTEAGDTVFLEVLQGNISSVSLDGEPVLTTSSAIVERRWFNVSAGLWSEIDTLTLKSDNAAVNLLWNFTHSATVDSATTITVTPVQSTINPGGFFDVNISGAGTNPSYALIGSKELPIFGTSTFASIEAPGLDSFKYEGDLYFYNFGYDIPFRIYFAGGRLSEQFTMQVLPDTSLDYVYTVTGNDAATIHETDTQVGDQVYIRVISGDVNSISTTGVVILNSNEAVLERRWYNVSRDRWSAVDTLTLTSEGIQASDSWTFSALGLLDAETTLSASEPWEFTIDKATLTAVLYSFPTTGTNGDPLDSNWYNVAVQFGATIEIWGNKIRYTGNGHPNAAGRIVLLNGTGDPISINNFLLEYDVDLIEGYDSNTIVTTFRKTDIESWRGNFWFSFPVPYDGYNVWGWQYGRGRQILHKTVNGVNTRLYYDAGQKPGNGNTYNMSISAADDNISYTRRLNSGSPPEIDFNTTDSTFSNGFIAIGFGGADLTVDIYNLSITAI